MKQKELLDKLESLEKEIHSLKEKKQNKIHYLFLQIMGKYTKKQIFVFSIVFMFLLTCVYLINIRKLLLSDCFYSPGGSSGDGS